MPLVHHLMSRKIDEKAKTDAIEFRVMPKTPNLIDIYTPVIALVCGFVPNIAHV